MTHRGPFQPLLFCDSVGQVGRGERCGCWCTARRSAPLPRGAGCDALPAALPRPGCRATGGNAQGTRRTFSNRDN